MCLNLKICFVIKQFLYLMSKFDLKKHLKFYVKAFLIFLFMLYFNLKSFTNGFVTNLKVVIKY